ncbi:hypothetical protein HDE68_004185 [Pedobacter cryoconitis]|uniref:ATPase family protein associated with various cellular activities (AAA) n=1 Tax=Pedobacter cryoconitis TaxID=188932 RepID=A0A7W9E0N8_9SPHI|nr:ATP-binding protein [Pedobacter cryoconitis]MBB5638256.1 hypothetical protein [Pedobacter cryoconitis]
MTTYPPPIRSLNNQLPLAIMPWEQFELLCLDMVVEIDNYPIAHTHVFGIRGQDQSGIDIYAGKPDVGYSTYQCKRVQVLNPADLRKIVQLFITGNWSGKSNRFVLCTTTEISSTQLLEEFEEHKNDLLNLGIEFDKWDANFINRSLKAHPRIVYNHFGEAWCKAHCGDALYEKEIGGKARKITEIMEHFGVSSITLNKIAGVFGNSRHHIVREETRLLQAWLEKPLANEKKGLAVLEGGAGLGKTIILKDLFSNLSENGIPVLAIKSDLIKAPTLSALEERLFGRTDLGIIDSVKALLIQYPQVVILIDQLDALSFTHSVSKDFIITYTQLIYQLLAVPGTRIIFSARTFDLDYDSELKAFKDEQYYKIKASTLTADQVKIVLSEISVHHPSPQLVELLRIPNHLNMFCMLDHKARHAALLINSQKKLFDALWKSIMSKCPDKRKLKDLFFAIAKKLSEHGLPIVPDNYGDNYEAELAFAKSNQIIIEDPNGLSFFHQTFYEYTFALQFVESGQDLIAFIFQEHQGIAVRPVVKMVTDYLREIDNTAYIKTFAELISRKDTRFHLKVLLISGFARIQLPTAKEYQLFKEVILTEKRNAELFFGSLKSNGWYTRFLVTDDLKNLYTEGIVNAEYQYQVNWVLAALSTHFSDNLEQSITFFKQLENSGPLTESIDWVLSSLDDWRNPALLVLFDEYIIYSKTTETINYYYLEVLKKILLHHPEFVFHRVVPVLKQELAEAEQSGSDYYLQDVLTLLYDQHPDKTFELIFVEFMEIMENTKEQVFEREYDFPFFNTLFQNNYRTHHHLDSMHTKIFEICEAHLIARVGSSWFNEFFSQHLQTPFIAFIGLFIKVLTASPDPEKAVELLKILKEKNFLMEYDSDIQEELRVMLGKNFALMSAKTQQITTEILLSIFNYKPYRLTSDWRSEEKQKPEYAGWRQFKYLKALPYEHVMVVPDLKRRVGEWQRLFNVIRAIKKWDPVSETGKQNPLTKPAFDKLSLGNWERIMFTYHPKNSDKAEHHRDFLDMVSQIEDAFEMAVSLESVRFYPFVKDMFNQQEHYSSYLKAGLRGLIKAKYDPLKIRPIYEAYISACQTVYDHANCLYLFDYFSGSGTVNQVLFDYVKQTAIDHLHIEDLRPKQVGSKENTLQIGSRAVTAVMYCFKHDAFFEEIFEFANWICLGEDDELKIALMGKFKNIWAMDRKRAFSNFQLLTTDGSNQMIIGSLSNALFIKDYYLDQMHSYFAHIMATPELITEASINIFINGYYQDQKNLQPYLEKLLRPDSLVLGRCVQVAEQYLLADKVKGLALYSRIAGYDSENMSRELSAMILRKFKLMSFETVLPFLRVYNQSVSAQRDPGYYFQYLLSQVREHPYECLELLSAFNFGEALQRRSFMEKLPIQLVLAIYTNLSAKQAGRNYLEKLMDVFDTILLSEAMRSKADTIIETMDN